MDKVYYITTPIYYVNAKPHIGHAYTNILCDTFARFHRFQDREVFFLTGTDEHGGKIERTAREQGKDPKAFVDEVVVHFKELWTKLGITYDYFIRTTDPTHKEVVKKVLQHLYEKGDIYQDKYKGWYCVPCESFWSKIQLAEGKCPACQREVQELEEENFFFKMSKYQDWLIEYITQNPDFIYPLSRRAEILSFLKKPLEDLCITRPKIRLPWGIPFPLSEDHVVYVWFDALVNYISAIAYSLEEEKFNKFWPADLHMVGKDILRQHVVYWPIMLKALGIAQPKSVFAHGWWRMEEDKISKSKGNIVDPREIVDKYGVDCFRYFLLREVTLCLDGSYLEEFLINRFNNDLANDLGNLVHRSFGMLEKYFQGRIPECEPQKIKVTLRENTLGLWSKVQEAMGKYDPKTALEAIWALINEANKFVEDSKPWLLAREDKKKELVEFMYCLFEVLRFIGVILKPFLPETSTKILHWLGMEGEVTVPDLKVWGLLRPGSKLRRLEPLFPKIN